MSRAGSRGNDEDTGDTGGNESYYPPQIHETSAQGCFNIGPASQTVG